MSAIAPANQKHPAPIGALGKVAREIGVEPHFAQFLDKTAEDEGYTKNEQFGDFLAYVRGLRDKVPDLPEKQGQWVLDKIAWEMHAFGFTRQQYFDAQVQMSNIVSKIDKIGAGVESIKDGQDDIAESLRNLVHGTSVKNAAQVDKLENRIESLRHQLESALRQLESAQDCIKAKDRVIQQQKLELRTATFAKIANELLDVQPEPAESKHAEAGDENQWVCAICTFLNNVDLPICEICNASR